MTLLDRLPAEVDPIATSAIHPLEIAAHLEAAGISNRVARDVHGAADVFELAEQLWAEVPFVETAVEPEPLPRSGNVSDLGRGLVYGAPGLLLFAVQRQLGWAVSTWVLAVAVIWGWGLGQLVASLAYTLRSRHDGDGERFLVGVLLVATPLTTALGLVVAARFVTVGSADLAVAAGLTTYMVASAVLVLHDRVGLAAWCMVPGAVAAAVAFVHDQLDGVIVAAAVGASCLAAVGAAARYASLRPRGRGAFASGELLGSLVHLVHGFVCGGALAAVVLIGSDDVQRQGALAAMSVPLVLSLGVMEWQLHSFRHGAARLQSVTSVREYADRTWRLFRATQVRYAAAAALLCLAAAVLSGALAHPAELALLATAALLGVVYHLDVTMVSLGRVDLAMWSWLGGATTAAVVVLAGSLLGTQVGLAALAAGFGTCVVVFVAVAPAPVCAAVHH